MNEAKRSCLKSAVFIAVLAEKHCVAQLLQKYSTKDLKVAQRKNRFIICRERI